MGLDWPHELRPADGKRAGSPPRAASQIEQKARTEMDRILAELSPRVDAAAATADDARRMIGPPRKRVRDCCRARVTLGRSHGCDRDGPAGAGIRCEELEIEHAQRHAALAKEARRERPALASAAHMRTQPACEARSWLGVCRMRPEPTSWRGAWKRRSAARTIGSPMQRPRRRRRPRRSTASLEGPTRFSFNGYALTHTMAAA